MYRFIPGCLCIVAIVLSLSVTGKSDTLQQVNSGTHTLDTLQKNQTLHTAPPAVRHFREGFTSRYKDKNFDYSEKQKKPTDTKPGFFTRLLQNLLGTDALEIIINLIRLGLYALGIWLLYLLVSIALGKKGNWLFADKGESLVRYGTDDEVTGTSDFSTMISMAVANGDYRTAIRYQYLNLLHKLHAKGKIEYHADKTNADYQYEIRDQSLARSFQYVSYIYDHAWYGEFDLNAREYSRAENAFITTSKLAGHG